VPESVIYFAMGKPALFILVCLFQLSLSAQDSVTIGKYRHFVSKILGGEVTYLEHLPDGYEKSGKTYPVIFSMNGQNISQFANEASILDNLSNDRIPDFILIGISNTGVAGKYWPCPDDSGHVREADTFCTFLKNELIPEINKEYRTNGYQILNGQSNAGLLVMYNFLFQPDLFDAYVIASPMLGWCPDFYIDKTDTLFRDHPGISNKLYISYGGLDYVQVTDQIGDLRATLEQSPESLMWKIGLIENSGHVPFETLNNALLFFFSECTLNADRRKFTVPEIKSHFASLSEKYGFNVIPKAGVLFDMAIDLNDAQKPDQSIELTEYLISLYPDSGLYLYYLGRLYQEKGNIDSAKEYYEKSLGINPDYDRAKMALQNLNQK